MIDAKDYKGLERLPQSTLVYWYFQCDRTDIHNLGWKTIEQLINRQVNITVFKCLHGIAPEYLSDIFTKNAVNAIHSLRDTSTDLRLPLKRSANGQKCFSFRGSQCWNSVSTEAKQASSIKAFKSHIQPRS